MGHFVVDSVLSVDGRRSSLSAGGVGVVVGVGVQECHHCLMALFYGLIDPHGYETFILHSVICKACEHINLKSIKLMCVGNVMPWLLFILGSKSVSMLFFLLTLINDNSFQH